MKKKETILELLKINLISRYFLHAKEIIQRLGDGTLDVGISGLDLLKGLIKIYRVNKRSKT